MQTTSQPYEIYNEDGILVGSVVAESGDFCAVPHQWGNMYMGETLKEAKQRFLSGNRV